MFNTIEMRIGDNKENIPPGSERPDSKEGFVMPVPRVPGEIEVPASPVPKPSPALSQKSDASFISFSGSLPDSPNVTLDENDDDPEVTSRKEKSLGLLCQRFLIAMNEETRESPMGEVHLETVARKMNVEKRRIYDIVNVMEALDAMSKTNKSFYRWHGLDYLPKLMYDLQQDAIFEKLPERVMRVEQAMCSFTELSTNRKQKDAVGSLIGDVPSTSDAAVDLQALSVSEQKKSRVEARDRQGRNSLAQLCRRFLMVLLSNPKYTRKVSLDVASTVLIKDPETEGFEPPSRSRCRRLYDIANVLVALGLIKKVHYLFGTKKIPLFVYCGPEPDLHAKFDANACVERLLLASCQTPLTPQMKANNLQMAHKMSMGKRSTSEASLGNVKCTPKIARIRTQENFPTHSPGTTPNMPPCSLMMFAELAAAEKFRIEMFAQKYNLQGLLPSTSNGLPPMPGNSPLSANSMLPRFPPMQLPSLIPRVQSTVPAVTVPRQSAPPAPQPIRPVAESKSNLQSENSVYSMNRILGNSNKQNLFEHTNNSPFQVVKKEPSKAKRVFGELQNL